MSPDDSTLPETAHILDASWRCYCAFDLRVSWEDGARTMPRFVVHSAEHLCFIYFGATVKGDGGLNINLYDSIARNTLLTGKNVRRLRAVLNSALLAEPSLRAPLKADADGWRQTLVAVFGDDYPRIGSQWAYHIARGLTRKSATSGTRFDGLDHWTRSSTYGDNRGRHHLQPVSLSHFILQHQGLLGCLFSSLPEYPPALLRRWIEVVSTASASYESSSH